MMEYNPKYVHFEPVDDLIGKWCIARDSIYDIKNVLAGYEVGDKSIKENLVQIKETRDLSYPFNTTEPVSYNSSELTPWKFVYVDSAFQLMMREIYVGIDPEIELTYSINSNKFKYVYYKTSDIEDAKEWVAKRRKFEAVMGAWEDGAAIEAKKSGTDWFSVNDPTWDPDAVYRVRRDEKVLEWTDLKIGDVIRYKPTRNLYIQVQGINKGNNTSEHILAGCWRSDDDLAEYWEKVDE